MALTNAYRLGPAATKTQNKDVFVADLFVWRRDSQGFGQTVPICVACEPSLVSRSRAPFVNSL
jgi:hypothetical protein